ncbi:hypothetical protein BJV78DRAFT_654743 [Lactifluus subvellereus]|nr:hypothetical protein BJV78DRAFT_654743 [Lactifluus subvellereus]
MDQANVVYVHDFFTVVRVLHFIDGVKLLNLLANLDFDWKLLRRKPAPTWPSIQVYLAERLVSLACVVSFLVGLDTKSRINCQTWISTAFAFPLIELELALILIVVRVIAIWKCSNPIISLTLMTLSVHSVASIYLLTGIRAFWYTGPDYHGCVIFAPWANLLSMSIVTIAAYATLLLAMLAGLLRQEQARSSRISSLLFQQGCIWFALAVVAEVPTLALVLANVNRSIHLLLQVPRVVIASIGTTTMFRVLHNYAEKQGTRRRVWLGPNSMAMTSTGSFSRPLVDNDLKVSVTSTTVQFSDDGTQKQGL